MEKILNKEFENAELAMKYFYEQEDSGVKISIHNVVPKEQHKGYYVSFKIKN